MGANFKRLIRVQLYVAVYDVSTTRKTPVNSIPSEMFSAVIGAEGEDNGTLIGDSLDGTYLGFRSRLNVLLLDAQERLKEHTTLFMQQEQEAGKHYGH